MFSSKQIKQIKNSFGELVSVYLEQANAPRALTTTFNLDLKLDQEKIDALADNIVNRISGIIYDDEFLQNFFDILDGYEEDVVQAYIDIVDETILSPIYRLNPQISKSGVRGDIISFEEDGGVKEIFSEPLQQQKDISVHGPYLSDIVQKNTTESMTQHDEEIESFSDEHKILLSAIENPVPTVPIDEDVAKDLPREKPLFTSLKKTIVNDNEATRGNANFSASTQISTQTSTQNAETSQLVENQQPATKFLSPAHLSQDIYKIIKEGEGAAIIDPFQESLSGGVAQYGNSSITTESTPAKTRPSSGDEKKNKLIDKEIEHIIDPFSPEFAGLHIINNPSPVIQPTTFIAASGTTQTHPSVAIKNSLETKLSQSTLEKPKEVYKVIDPYKEPF